MGKSRNGGIGIAVGTSIQHGFIQNDLSLKINEIMTNEPRPFDSKLFEFEESKEKYENYLLDLNHPKGGSKAKFLKEVLGYEKVDEEKLHRAISDAIDGKLPTSVVNNDFGIKYNFDIKLASKDKKDYSASVTIVLQRDSGKIKWRLITLIPGKKDK